MDLLHFVGDIIGNYDVFIGQLVALITLIWADCWKLCRGHQDGISFYYFFFMAAVPIGFIVLLRI